MTWSSTPKSKTSGARLFRRIGGVGEEHIFAEWLWNSSSGSFWLPPPPPPDQRIGGYEVRVLEKGSSSSKFLFEEYGKPGYGGKIGFVREDQVNIFMSHMFNAGDFLACFIAPLIAGRPAGIQTTKKNGFDGNKMSLNVVGSTLHWGMRYSWGPGFMTNKDKANHFMEMVFATRGPRTYENVSSSMSPGAKVSRVFGDAGSLLSWYYQPHNQTKTYSLCLLPHYGDKTVPFVKRIAEWWNGSYFIIDIMAPLFDIPDNIVRCQFVLSSSLHGIIFSDSYSIPNAHMKYREHVTGGHYKFEDYFASVGRRHEWFDMENESRWKNIAQWVSLQKHQYDASNIQLLPFWYNCPMHAEAYNRTREEHLQFARIFVKEFDASLHHRPKDFTAFHNQMRVALQRPNASADNFV